jgi:hypothetical protein
MSLKPVLKVNLKLFFDFIKSTGAIKNSSMELKVNIGHDDAEPTQAQQHHDQM